MYTITTNSEAFEERMEEMRKQLANFPTEMDVEAQEWELQDQNKQQPEVERPDSKSVRVAVEFSPRGARKNRASRVMERFFRRQLRRLLPKPLRMLNRQARLGRRILRKPETALLPAPIKRLRRFGRQFKRVAAGRKTAVLRQLPFGVGRAYRKVRLIGGRQRRQQELVEAFTGRMKDRAKKNLRWKEK